MLSTTINRISFALAPQAADSELADVLRHVHVLRESYPKFDTWMSHKVVPGIYSGGRSMLLEYRRGQLAGFAITKDDGDEKKLCCLRVMKDFQNTHGLGMRLFERAFDELGTEKPLLSVAEEKISIFKRIFDYYGFDLSQEYLGRYRSGKVEYAFNGLLDVQMDFSYPKKLIVESIVHR